MPDDRVLVIPLTSALVWAEVYGVIAVLVSAGFILQRVGWSDTKDRYSPAVWAVRVVGSAIVVGALWPLWDVIGAIALAVAIA